MNKTRIQETLDNLAVYREHISYEIISDVYRGKHAARSGEPYLKHIDQGLLVLAELGAPVPVAAAYALHPVFQSTAGIRDFTSVAAGDHSGNSRRGVLPAGVGDDHWTDRDLTVGMDLTEIRSAIDIVTFGTDYRHTANGFLSPHMTGDPAVDAKHLRLSAIPEVNIILYADKVQNKADFLIHHADTHPHADRLAAYFDLWLEKLAPVIDKLVDDGALNAPADYGRLPDIETH